MLHGRPTAGNPRFAARGGLQFVFGDVRDVVSSKKFDRALFQVASNFGALEFMSRDMSLADHLISWYPADHTQGPSIQVSALPQLLARHFFLPPVDMLAPLKRPYNVRSTASGWADLCKASPPDADAVSKVGSWLVERTDVVFKHPEEPEIPRAEQNQVSLVMSSAYDFTCPAPHAEEWAQVFLRAAYLNLFTAAIELRSEKVVMTLLGGGVFGNPKGKIAEAIAWAASHAPWPAGHLPQFYMNLFKESQRCPELDRLDSFFRGGSPL